MRSPGLQKVSALALLMFGTAWPSSGLPNNTAALTLLAWLLESSAAPLYTTCAPWLQSVSLIRGMVFKLTCIRSAQLECLDILWQLYSQGLPTSMRLRDC